MAFVESVNSKANVKQSTNNDLPFSPQQPVINSYYAVSTAGQTSIANLGFSIDTVNNPDVFFLFVDGKKLRLGSSNDYVFAAIGADGTSSQITFNSALPVNLNIQAYKLGLKPEVQFTMDNRFTSLFEEMTQGFQGFTNTTSFINTATATAGTPAAGTFYSSVSNRASMADLSQDLKPRMAIDRLITQNIQVMQGEVGPNLEPVYGVVNDLFGQVRFVGQWKQNVDVTGNYVVSSLAADFVEVTFYGTGLNILLSTATATYTLQYSVDGGTTTTYFNTALTGVLTSKNYTPNQVVPVIAGLTLGIHTIKLTCTTAATASQNVCGFEILNESSSVKTNSGISYLGGQKITTAAQSALAYNASVTGVRGGRVLVYQSSTGVITQAFTPVNSASAFLSAASHTNEEVARTYFWREFGAARSDDFSTLHSTGAQAAFTLEDGSTTLHGNNVLSTTNNNYDVVTINPNGAYITFNFVGTGIDMVEIDGSSGGSDTYNVFIDGVNVGNLPSAGSTSLRTVLIASGLPYGSHVLRILRVTASTWSPGILSFKVYQPKKPTLPSGAVELADYNVLATYVANTVSGSTTTQAAGIGTGVLRKSKTREFVYTGTWGVNQVDPINYLDGYDIDANATGSTVSYTFFGTGVDYRFPVIPSLNPNFTISIDGSTNLSGFTTSFYATNSTGVTWTPATGTLTGTVTGQSDGAGISISGLTLGVHTIKMTTNAAGRQFVDCLDIVTPIHSYRSDLYTDFQNTLPLGSQGISDNRKFTPVAGLPAIKAWTQALGITSAPTATGSLYVPCPDMSCTIKTSGGALDISYGVAFYEAASGFQPGFQIYVDGLPVGRTKEEDMPTGGYPASIADRFMIQVAAGFHKIDLYWNANGGTLTANGIDRNLTVREN